MISTAAVVLSALLLLALASVTVALNVLLRGRIYQRLPPQSRPRRWVLLSILVLFTVFAVWFPIWTSWPQSRTARLLTIMFGALFFIVGMTRRWFRGRLPSERQEARQSRAKPLLDPLRQWFEETIPKLSRKSDTTSAIRYALGLTSTDAPLRRRSVGDRQQQRRTRFARCGSRKKELLVCWFGPWRRASDCSLQPDCHCEAERMRPRRISAECFVAHLRSSDQPDCRTPAVESRRGIAVMSVCQCCCLL